MLADKMAAITGTGAQFCTAGDASCLMHIGGGPSRAGSPVRTVHLAEICAARTLDIPRRAGYRGNLRGDEPFQKRAARRALTDDPDAPQRRPRHPLDPRQTVGGVQECWTGEELRLAGSAIRADVRPGYPELLEELENNVTRHGGWCTGPATPTRPTASSPG